MMKKGIAILIVAAAWGHAALPALADGPLLGGFVSAVSADSAAARLEARSMALVAPRVVSGTQSLISSNGLTVTAWDTTALANGWHEVEEPTGGEKASLLVANLPSIAVEGGRLSSSATWTSNAVHWVRNRVIVPSGVTLTVAAGAVVKFGEQTGMLVEDGGTVKFNGNSSAPVVLTHFADDVYGGDSDFGATNAVWNSWSLTARSGGTISDLYTQVRYGTVGSLPTLSMPTAVTASRSTGKARVSVSFDAAPTKRAALTWRTVDGTAKYGTDFTQNSGTAVWVSGTTVYFDIPLAKLDDVQEVRTFTIELVTVEGANANPSRLKTTVSITGGDGAVEVPTCAESEESEAIRLETRDPDPKPEPVPATIAIEGGRLQSNAIWDSAATNFVLNTVVVPSGITLTVVTNAVVYFTPNTGIKVEQGGALRVVGSAEQPAVFTAAAKGDWALTVVEGGAFSDSYALFEKTTISQHPTVTVPNGCEVSEKDGEVRVPVAVSGSRTSAFRVKWRAIDGTAKFGEDYTLAAGEVEWGGASEGTKYITIPISNDDVEEESETFVVELCDAQGANIGASYRCTVLVRDGTAALVPLATCVESEESEAIRLETREPDPKPEVVPATIAIEGGRLLANAIWDSAATNFVLNTVVVPSGITLTVVTNAVVYFTPYTGIKVEPGGALRCIGSQECPVVFAAANDGDYTINVVSGGTFTDTWTAFRNLNYGGFGTVSLDGSLVVDADEGVMRIPVYISGSRTSTFSVDWEGSDGTTGTIVWNNANEGKKWIELPIEGRADGFSLWLTEGRGINISGTAHEIAVKVFTSAAPKAVCAVSADSEAVRFECRAEGTLGRALVRGTEYIAADGETRAVAWDSTAVADGWQANGTLVRNDATIAIECGRLQAPTETYTTPSGMVVTVTLPVVWSNDVTHLVRSWVIVPNGVTLRIEAGTVVKFCELTGFKVEQGGKLIVAGTEESPVVYTAAADDTIGGDSDLREATPNDGDYSVNIVSGGTYTDSNCAVRYTTFSNLGTATMTANALAALTDGIVRIPVTISTDRTTKFCVDWRTGGDDDVVGRVIPNAPDDGGLGTGRPTSGRLTWNSKNDGTKYIELPLAAGAITNDLETFTVELYESQGINISTTARRCNVTIYSNDRFPQGAYAESEESAAVRFEAREYDSDLEIEASESIAIEGGRLSASATWSNAVTHLVRQWVVVPSGVTLTIQAGTVVKFLPYTGIKVEPGGRVNANGTAANNIIFTSVADDTVGGDTDGKEAAPQNGNYSISVISGGAFSTAETQLRYGTSGTFGSLYIMENAVAKKDDGWVKIPVCVSAASPQAFSVDWEVVESSVVGRAVLSAPHGRLDWPANSTATKYIEIPLDRMAEAVEGETFTVELTFTRGINLNQSRKACLVTLYDTVNALAGANIGHAESGWCEFAPMDASAGTGPMFAMGEVPIRYSTRWADNGAGLSISVVDASVGRAVPSAPQATLIHESSTAAEGDILWNGADYEDGRYDLTHKILDADGHSIKIDSATFIVNRDVVQHAGRLADDETWTADKVHLVVATVTVPSGVTLTIAPDAIVKFMPGTSIVVEKDGLGICKGAVLTHAYDDVMGGDTFFDGAETVPEDGGYSLSGDWEDDESTQYRYSMPLEVSGTLKGENRWPGHKTYIVTGNLTLASGATLTIDAGAVVKFKSGLSFTVNSGATLNAQGTRSSPVVFTSFKDDAHGGDTNGDGKNTVAQGGDWGTLSVSGVANFEYAIIQYGGSDVVRLNGGTINFNNSEIAHANEYCVDLEGGTWNMRNSVFRDFYTAFRHWSTKFSCVNSVFYDCSYISNNGGQSFVNCTFERYSLGLCWWTDNSTYRNCVFWNPPEDSGSPQSCTHAGSNGNIWGDPKFENAEKGDFRLKADSPCVDAGDGTVAPEKDYYNQPRQTIQTVTPTGTPGANGAYADIGIYEVQPRNAGADVDLEVKTVMAPETMTVGELVTVSWREANIGSVDTDGKWYDKVELISANGAVVTLGTVPVTGIPAGGEKTITETAFRVPAVAEGACTIRVTANYNRDIYEGSLTANNVGVSGAATVSVAGIDFGEDDVAKVKLLSESQTSYSMTGLPTGGGSLLIHSASGESFGAYVAFGKMPTTYVSESAYTVLPNGDVLVSIPPHSGEDTVYLMLDSRDKVQNGALDVMISDVYPAIYSLSKESMPNTGNQSLTIYGVGLDEVASVALVAADGTSISGTSVRAANACELSASFALTGAKTGAYRVAVTAKDGKTAESTATVSVIPHANAKAKLEISLDAPSAIRQNRWYEAIVTVKNTGDADAVVPIVVLNGKNIEFKDPDGGLDTYEGVIHVLPFAQGSNPLVLGPGDSSTIHVIYRVTALSSGTGIRFGILEAKDAGWSSFIAQGTLSDAEWAEYQADYASGFDSPQDFLDAVYAKAAVISACGYTPVNAIRLFDVVQREKKGEKTGVVSGVVLNEEGVPQSGIQFGVGTIESDYLAEVTTDVNGMFCAYGVPTGAVVFLSSEYRLYPDEDELELTGGVCINTSLRVLPKEDIEKSPEIPLAKAGVSMLQKFPLGEGLLIWNDESQQLRIGQSVGGSVSLPIGGSVDSYYVVSVSNEKAVIVGLASMQGTNTLFVLPVVFAQDGRIATGEIQTFGTDVYGISQLSRINDTTFSMIYVRTTNEENNATTYFRRNVDMSSDFQNISVNANLSSPKRLSSVRLLSAGETQSTLDFIDLDIDTNWMLEIGADYKGVGFSVGNGWPINEDTGIEKKACCMWQQTVKRGTLDGAGTGALGGEFHLPFKKIATAGLLMNVEGTCTEKNAWYCARCFKDGYNDCKKEHAVLTASSFKGTSKAEGGMDVSIGKMVSIPIDKLPPRFKFLHHIGLNCNLTGKLSITSGYSFEDRYRLSNDGRSFSSSDADYGVQIAANLTGSVVPCAMISATPNKWSHDVYAYVTSGLNRDNPVKGEVSANLAWRLAAKKRQGLWHTRVSEDFTFDARLGMLHYNWKRSIYLGNENSTFNIGYIDTTKDIPTQSGQWELDTDTWKMVERPTSRQRLRQSLLNSTFSEEESLLRCVKLSDTVTLNVFSVDEAVAGKEHGLVVCREYLHEGIIRRGVFFKPEGSNEYTLLNTFANDVDNCRVHRTKDDEFVVIYLASEPNFNGTAEDLFASYAIKGLYALRYNGTGRPYVVKLIGGENLTVNGFSSCISDDGTEVLTTCSVEDAVTQESGKVNMFLTGTENLETEKIASAINSSNTNVCALISYYNNGRPEVAYAQKNAGEDAFFLRKRYVKENASWQEVTINNPLLLSVSSNYDDNEVHNATTAKTLRDVGFEMRTLLGSSNAGDGCTSGCHCNCNEPPHTPRLGCLCPLFCKCGGLCPLGECKCHEQHYDFTTPHSYDPNEMVGPAGVGEQRYVKPGEWMDYTIYFENATNATAAAQDVYVTLPKDAGLDWSTFELGEVVFGDNIDTGLSGAFDGVSSYALPSTNWSVRTEVTHADDSVEWHLRIVDPTTADNYPVDAYAGFLPPNDETGRGEGHLRYRVRVKDGAIAGSVINATATIHFDPLNGNTPIETDPAWWNTVGIYHTPTLDLGDGVTTNLLLIAGQPFGELPAPPERKNWKFDGWYTGPNGTGLKATPDAIVPEGEFSLYENWVVDGGIARFEKSMVSVDEGSNAVVRVHGGNADGASSVKVYLTYNSATAADVNLKTAAWGQAALPSDGESVGRDVPIAPQQTNLKFPLTLKWAAGEIGEKVIEIPVKADALIEGGEMFTLQLAAASGQELGDERVCTVRINDAQWPDGMSGEETAARGLAALPAGATAMTNESGVVMGYFTKKDKKGNVTAKAMPGYVFAGWVYSANGKTYSTKATITDKLRRSKKVSPKFVEARYVRALADPANGGKATGSGRYADGKVVTLKATPTKYWSFEGWYMAGARDARPYQEDGLVSKKASIKVAATNDATYFATFKPYPKVTVAVEGAKGGTVKGAGSYLAGKTVTLKATPKKGYAFTGWYDGSNLVTLAATYRYRMTADGAALTAGFKKESALARPEFVWDGATNLTMGVCYAAKLSVVGESAVSITKVAGLPKGLAYKGGKVSGVPAKAGSFTATVTVALVSNKKKTWVYKVKLAVAALPAFAQGTFSGWSYAVDESGEDGHAGRVTLPVRKVTVSVTGAGKITAKVGTLSLARTGWTVGEDGLYTATLSKTRTVGTGKKAKKYKDVLTLTLDPDKVWTEDQLSGSFSTFLTTAPDTPVNADTVVSVRRNPFGDKENLEAKAVAAELAARGVADFIDGDGVAWKQKVSTAGVATISRTTGSGKKKQTVSATAVVEVDADGVASARFLVGGKVVEAKLSE